jgi:hypothetical protein
MKTVQPMTGAREVTIAVGQPEYDALICAEYVESEMNSPLLVSRWKPSDEEREALAAGDDIYLSILTFGRPMQPVAVQVGAAGLIAGSAYPNYCAVL